MRILAIFDQLLIGSVFECLEALDHQVDIVQTHRAALLLLKTKCYDMVLCQSNLGQNSQGALKCLRSIRKAYMARIPFLACQVEEIEPVIQMEIDEIANDSTVAFIATSDIDMSEQIYLAGGQGYISEEDFFSHRLPRIVSRSIGPIFAGTAHS